MILLSGCLCFGFISRSSVGQDVCPEPTIYTRLDVNKVSALLGNRGLLFFGRDVGTTYIPKADSIAAFDGGALWLGGYVGGELKITRPGWVTTIGAGPLAEGAVPPVDCSKYNRFFAFDSDDLALEDTSANLVQWPHELGAPIIDGDGVDGNYDYRRGDRPALLGNAMKWWIMNDMSGTNRSSPPVGVEIRATAFAFDGPGVLETTTFYRYLIRNRREQPIDGLIVGFWASMISGWAFDDLAGTDTTRNLIYVYDYDDNDAIYSERLPAGGILLLKSPLAISDLLDNDRDGLVDEEGEELGMTASVIGDDVHEDYGPENTYNHLLGRCQSRPAPARFYESVGCISGAIDGEQPTPYWYSGEPGDSTTVTGTASGGSSDPNPGFKSALLSTGPTILMPGDEIEVVFATLWARGTDYLDSVRLLQEDADRLHFLKTEILTPDSTRLRQNKPELEGLESRTTYNYPNPVKDRTSIAYELDREARVSITVFDLLGREITVVLDEVKAAGKYVAELDMSRFPTGTYFYRTSVGRLSMTGKMLVVH